MDDITFSSEPVPSVDTDFRVGVDHSSRAAQLFGDHVEIASIIVVSDPLEPDLWHDATFATWTARVGVSHARAEARRRLSNLRIGPERLEARAAELGFPPRGASGDEDEPGYHSAVLDAMYDEHEVIEMLAVLDEERADGAVEWIDDEPRDIDQAEATLRWQTRLRELVAPQPLIERRRRYDLPPPLNSWDPRNAVQQWYFTLSHGRLEYSVGGSASSGQRESHGRWAHTFAMLATAYGVATPTTVMRYDCRNVLRLIRDSPTLLVDWHDLVGNYRVDHDESQTLMTKFTINAHGLRRSP